MAEEERSEQRQTHRSNGEFEKDNPWAFEPGKSGNPGGRPKGKKPADALLETAELTHSELSSLLSNPNTPAVIRMAVAEWIRATDIDGRNANGACSRIYDRIDGPVGKEAKGHTFVLPTREVVMTEIREDKDSD